MKTNFLSIFSAFFLCFCGTASAKEIWLKCGSYEVNLDSEKERYSMEVNSKIYQGPAVFNPGQINFSVQWVTLPGGGGIRYDYAINRKNLEYTQTTLNKIVLGSFSNTGWTEAKDGKEIGTCKLIKNPTEGNKI